MTFFASPLNRRTALRGAAAAALLATMAFATPGLAQEIKIEHAQGTLTLPAAPKKVLVFDVASLDTLDALGVEVAGVPTAQYTGHLAKFAADKYLKIGSLFEPDFEKVNAAKADLIIAGGRSAAKYADLAKIAPTIDLTVDAKDFLGSVKKNARTLGAIFGKQAEVTEQIAALDKAIATTKAATAKAGKGLMVLTTGNRMSAYGPGSRFGILHSDFGVIPAREGLATTNHGQPVSFEFILETNPDWLFVLDRDAAIGREGASAKQFLDNPLVGQTTAWKKGQVVYLNAANWYVISGGITALRQNAEQISEALSK